MRKKYKYDPQLKVCEFFYPPVIPPLLPAMQKLLGVLYQVEKLDKNLTVEEISIPGSDGHEIRTLIFTPKACAPGRPAIIFYHGGGFVFQAAPHHFALAKEFAKKLNVKVFFVDYRLAPTHTFPIAPQDCFDAYKWIIENSKALYINEKKIALCGDSAGGNLAAVVSLMAKEEKAQMPCCQVLLYPFTDKNTESESMLTYTDTPMWNSNLSKKMKDLYFPFDDHEKIAYYSPCNAKDFTELSPAYIETAEHDCLKDGGILFAKQLKQGGNEVRLTQVKDTMHGYDFAFTSTFVKNLNKKRIAYLKEKLF